MDRAEDQGDAFSVVWAEPGADVAEADRAVGRGGAVAGACVALSDSPQRASAGASAIVDDFTLLHLSGEKAVALI